MKLKNSICAQMNAKQTCINVPAKAGIKLASLNCCIVG